jgi:hypothetical protein
MMSEKRYRLEQKFWLNINNELERHIADIVEWLKNEHQYARAVRDGIRLIWSLRHQNSTDVLLELFPNIREMLDADCNKAMTPDPDKIDRRLANIEAILKQKLTNGYVGDIPDNRPGGYISAPGEKLPGTLSSQQFTLPVYDDDDSNLLGSKQVIETKKSFIEVMLDGGLDNVLAAGVNHTAEANELTLKNLRQH